MRSVLIGVFALMAVTTISQKSYGQTDVSACDPDGLSAFVGDAYQVRREAIQLIGSFAGTTRCQTQLLLSDKAQDLVRRIEQAIPMLPDNAKKGGCVIAYGLLLKTYYRIIYDIKSGSSGTEFVVTGAEATNSFLKKSGNLAEFGSLNFERDRDALNGFMSLNDEDMLKAFEGIQKLGTQDRYRDTMETMCFLLTAR